MSRIDLIYVSGPVLANVQEVSILPRGISDHAPLLMHLNVMPAPTDCLWHLSHFWVLDDCIVLSAESALQTYC